MGSGPQLRLIDEGTEESLASGFAMGGPVRADAAHPGLSASPTLTDGGGPVVDPEAAGRRRAPAPTAARVRILGVPLSGWDALILRVTSAWTSTASAEDTEYVVYDLKTHQQKELPPAQDVRADFNLFPFSSDRGRSSCSDDVFELSATYEMV
jgi:hypothetical protein